MTNYPKPQHTSISQYDCVYCKFHHRHVGVTSYGRSRSLSLKLSVWRAIDYLVKSEGCLLGGPLLRNLGGLRSFAIVISSLQLTRDNKPQTKQSMHGFLQWMSQERYWCVNSDSILRHKLVDISTSIHHIECAFSWIPECGGRTCNWNYDHYY